MSEEEKNSIREQHTGGKKVMTENFGKLLNSKLGDAKPFINEQSAVANAVKSALPSFKAEAVVEDDMMMEFPVVGLKISNGKYSMEIFDKTHNKIQILLHKENSSQNKKKLQLIVREQTSQGA
jgi:hypothetical protein